MTPCVVILYEVISQRYGSYIADYNAVRLYIKINIYKKNSVLDY